VTPTLVNGIGERADLIETEVVDLSGGEAWSLLCSVVLAGSTFAPQQQLSSAPNYLSLENDRYTRKTALTF
jgi:hypothetical protein